MTFAQDITTRLLGDRVPAEHRYLVFSKSSGVPRYDWEAHIWSQWEAIPIPDAPLDPYRHELRYLEVAPNAYATIIWSVSDQAWCLSLCDPSPEVYLPYLRINDTSWGRLAYIWAWSTAPLPSWVLAVPGRHL